jgi:(1->4)-alpha-D-glucan 1-alpha-D-glucosylmutase
VTAPAQPAACQNHAAVIIPRATYRLQFNSAFTLADATELVPYLAELGISHCYASPYLRARPGSTHGYDIVDHNAINPEIGSREDFERFVETLAAHGMGHILDMVPNHMGVMGADNAWWLDVLENGEASVYADHFDIDWRPLNPQLHGKVLLPLLGDHYGSVLARGELQLAFNAERGEFDIIYFEHRLPIDPAEYPRIVGHGIERLADALGAANEHLLELQSLLTAFGNLPSRHGIDASRRAERDRDKEIHKRRLAALAAAEPAIQRHIADCVAALNGDPQDPDSFDGLHGLIRAQAWRAAYWRVAADDINYRRFFDINDLAGLRMENPAVFDATHRLVLELIGAGKLHGLRIDHPDGLYDPRGYFERLQGAVRERTGAAPNESPDALPLYLVVEKILAEHERLPDDWPVHGTTGYHFANQVNGLFVDTAAQRRMGRIYADFVRAPDAFDELVYQCKRLIMRTSLASELGVLATRLARIAAASRHTCDFTLNGLRTALGEVVACFPVYRSYLVDGVASTDDRRHIEWAVAVARRRSQAADVSIFDFVRDVLTADIGAGKSDGYRADVNSFAMKLQQFSAPVTAKGLEDTAFYRYHRLCSLNEVGADPRRFGVSVAAFHAATRARHKRWPHEMLASSTHDSKRAEDVRARLNVLSELPAAWKLTAQRWRRLNRSRKRLVDDTPAPSANDEYLLYQTLIGSYPLAAPDADELSDYRTRIAAYMQKAVREAKQHSSWVNVNADYEAALAAFIDALLTPADSNLFLPELAAAAQRLAGHGLRNSLAQTLIKLTAPGVPDIYQGSELWQFHLVDPDNRRPVDYDCRRALLSEVKALPSPAPGGFAERLRPLLDDPADGRIKLDLTWRTLQLRSRWPDVFRDGEYVPLAATGAGAAHVVAYARRLGQRCVVVLVPRLLTRMAGGRDEAASAPDWGDTRIELPPAGAGGWHDVLTGRGLTADADGALGVGEALSGCPVALLVNDAALLAP